MKNKITGVSCILFFIFLLKMKNGKQVLYFIFCFFVKMKNERKNLKLRVKYRQNIKKSALLNFHFHFCIGNENKYSILNFVFQFIMKMKWHFGYTDYHGLDQKSITEIKKKRYFQLMDMICLINDRFSFFIIQKYNLSEIYC